MSLNICISIAKENRIAQVLQAYDADLYVFPEYALTGGRAAMLTPNQIKGFSKDVFLGAAVQEKEGCFSEYLYLGHKGERYVYRKTHLGEAEAKSLTAGKTLSIMQVNELNFGIAVCIESHMPAISEALCDHGAEVLLFPFAMPLGHGDRQSIWQKYLPARAYDNNAYVIATNLYGGMMAIAPDGTIIKEAYEQEAMIVTLDKEQVQCRRAKSKLCYNKKINKNMLDEVKKDGFGSLY